MVNTVDSVMQGKNCIMTILVNVNKYLKTDGYVTGFVKIHPNHTGTEIHFIAEH